MDDFMYDFGEGEVLSHHHKNGGGIVANSATVSDDCFVDVSARVYGSAVVKNRCFIRDDARVHGQAFICNDVVLEGSVDVSGTAEIKGGTLIFGDAKITVSPKIISGFDHPIVVTDDRIIVGCHSFTIEDWKEKALAIIRVNGYPTKTTKRIHSLITEISSIHFTLFSQEDIDDYFK
jgi:carbonic anhydrase/acetyltransferase-like protein (isoleucine patch superfamily)